MALGLTQPLTEISTRNISCEVKAAAGGRLTTLTLSYSDCLENLRFSASWNPQGLSRHYHYFYIFTLQDGCLKIHRF